MARLNASHVVQSLMILLFGAALFSIQTVNALRTVSQNETSRNPSSLSEQKISTENQVHPSFAVKMICGEDLVVRQTSLYPFVRVATPGCLKNETESVEITNMTNGYTASILKTASQIFTSDLIRLKPGTNRILIVGRGADGDYRQTLTVINNSSSDRQE